MTTPATYNLLDAIQDGRSTRADVAEAYAIGLGHEVDWALVNQAIMGRWSLSDLRHIKRRAWKPAS